MKDAIDNAEWENFWTITAWQSLTSDAGCRVFAVEARKNERRELVCTCEAPGTEKSVATLRFYDHVHTYKLLQMDVTFAEPPIGATVGWLLHENDSGGFDLYEPQAVTRPSKAPLEPPVEAE